MRASSAFRRVIRLQRQILQAIRADVRKAMGPQSREIRRYYESYKREFRGRIKHSSKKELLEAASSAQIILLGDYHTFGQSQKAALRLARELVALRPKLVLALELVPTRHQPAIDDYLSGKLSEEAFLERIEYRRNWGFSFDHFRPLFEFARAHGLAVQGLNAENDRLETRDAHAGAVLARLAADHPSHRVLAIYGDLHLAKSHIPRFLKAELKRQRLKARVLTIFQNSETIYWKLAQAKLAHTVDVIALGGDRFCIMNAAPWVKLQSYLDWVEQGEDIGPDDDGAGPDLHELAHERLRGLVQAWGVKLPESIDFTVQTVDDLESLSSAPSLEALSRAELRAVKYHVLGNRSIFVPSANLIYLPAMGINQLNEGVAMLAHSVLSASQAVHHEPRAHFFAAVVHAAISYFGSKVLNHRRKCDLENDLSALLERRLGRGALPGEKLQRRSAKLALLHCRAQREYLRAKRYQAPLSARGPGQIPVFLEATRKIGSILGEKLYASFIDGSYPAASLERLLRAELSTPRAARLVYLKLVADMDRAPLAHSSKLDLF